MKKFTREKNEKIWFIIFTAAGALVAAFELFQAAGFAVLHDYMRPYALTIMLLALSVIAAMILAKFRSYTASLVLTAIGSIGLSAVGYALTHPVKLTDEYYVSGLDTAIFWKFFAPSLLLLIPAAALVILNLKRKKTEYDARPYEKQF